MQSNLTINKKELLDAFRDTVCSYSKGQKSLAVDLDYSFSNWSQICGKPERFPLLKLPALMRITENLECLEVLADLFGYRLVPKELAVRDLVQTLASKLKMGSDVISDALQDLIDFNIRTSDDWRRKNG